MTCPLDGEELIPGTDRNNNLRRKQSSSSNRKKINPAVPVEIDSAIFGISALSIGPKQVHAKSGRLHKGSVSHQHSRVSLEDMVVFDSGVLEISPLR